MSHQLTIFYFMTVIFFTLLLQIERTGKIETKEWVTV